MTTIETRNVSESVNVKKSVEINKSVNDQSIESEINNLLESSDAEETVETIESNIEDLFEKVKDNLVIKEDVEIKQKTKRDSSQYVINPISKKKVKINGPKYKELIAAGHTFDLPDNYTEISEKIEKEKITKGHDLEKEVFNKVTNRWCKIGSPSHKKMIDQLKTPEKIIERKTIGAPSGRNVVVGGKTWLRLVKEGKIESSVD